jgi:DNA-binding PadR family transcriptional regulator
METARSELESFVLGLVWQLGPCSPYDLRTHMARSPSTQWSASAGAIYPLVKRLEKSGLLVSTRARNGKRQRREYRITPAGIRALRKWIGPPLAEAVTVAHDPLRNRARFLALLEPNQRLAWIDAARKVLDEVEARVQGWQRELAAPADPFAACMTKSGEIDVAGRRQWLQAVRKAAGARSR